MTLDVLASNCESSSPLAAVMRTLVQLARLEGPLRMLGPPTACDLPTFHHHLNALASQLNMLHDPKLIGEYLQSPSFSRKKYELFALQHMQLLVWLQRVQQGLLQGSAKTGEELTLFVQQIGHAARVLLFQPLLLHALGAPRAATLDYLLSLPLKALQLHRCCLNRGWRAEAGRGIREFNPLGACEEGGPLCSKICCFSVRP